MDKTMQWFRRLAFALSVARAIQWVEGGGAGVLAAGVAGVLLILSPIGLIFAALIAAGTLMFGTAAVVARLAWRSPKVIVGPPDLSDITITETHKPFVGGLMAAHAASATGSVTTATGREVSRPAMMVLVSVSNEQASSRLQATVSVYLSCWTEDESRRLTREVRAHERGAPVQAPPLELAATGAQTVFDSVCKVIEEDEAGLYVTRASFLTFECRSAHSCCESRCGVSFGRFGRAIGSPTQGQACG